ncbi:MAG: glycosyltransferase family 4 protein [Desertimonas sp.]
MAPLRVGYDVGPEYGHRTGVGVAVHEMRAALARRDDLTVVPYLLSFRTRPEPPVHRLALPATLAHRLWRYVSAPRVERVLGPLDIVHGTNYVAPPSGGARVVSVYDCWFLEHPDQARPDVRRAGEVLRRNVRDGVHVHASSHATAQRVRTLLGTDAVTVVHLGPPSEAGSDGAPPVGLLDEIAGRPIVLSLGTLERRKAVPTLVRAFGHIAGGDDDTVLVIAGAPGDDADAVATATASLDPRARARVLRAGSVDDATKRWLLHTARVLAYPSLDEGFGFPLLEAQRAGTPIVATRTGSIPEVAGKGAQLVAPGDVDDLANALRRVLDDDDRRAELIAAGHRNRARFSWDRTARAMAALYRRVVEQQR